MHQYFSWKWALAVLLFLLLCMAGNAVFYNSGIWYTRSIALAELRSIRTVEDENRVFRRIGTFGRSSFSLRDGQMNRVNYQTLEGRRAAKYVRLLDFGKPEIDQPVLDWRNIEELMRE